MDDVVLESGTAEAWCAFEGKGKHDDNEACHKDGDIDNADDFPPLEPCLSIPPESLHGTPESMREVEPDGD